MPGKTAQVSSPGLRRKAAKKSAPEKAKATKQPGGRRSKPGTITLMNKIAKQPKLELCKNCGKVVTKSRRRQFCSSDCSVAYWMKQRRIEYASKPCVECGKMFRPKRFGQECCTDLCRSRHRLDLRYFHGHRHSAVGFDEKTCWICGKTKLKKPHVHHVVGKDNSDEPLVVLCYGCHSLVGRLGQRNFLDDPEMIEDLLTLARFVKGLPNARTVVKFEEVE